MRDDELQAFVADARAQERAADRRRRRWLRTQLADDRTFIDVCRAAAARVASVEVTVAGSGTHRGQVVVVGRDVLGLVGGDGVAYIALDAVVALRTVAAPDVDVATAPASSARPDAAATVTTMTDALHLLAARRAHVDVGLVGGGRHRGRVADVGTDVLRLTDGSCLRTVMVTDVVPVR